MPPLPPRPTPKLPDWIRLFRAQPNYTSIFEIYSDEARCYGTEDWYGDWNAPILFLAKDAGSSRIFRPPAEGGRGWPWVTNHARPTNRHLKSLFDALPVSKLYASFLGPLLRNDDRESGELEMTAEIERFADELLRWTVAEMSQLSTVAVLGREAWIAATRAAGQPERGNDWKRRHEKGAPLIVTMGQRQIELVALNHPARIPAHELMKQAGWSLIFERHGGADTPALQADAPIATNAPAVVGHKGISPDDVWHDLAPRKTLQRRPENIRGEIYRILKASDMGGVTSLRFRSLEWREGLTADKLKVAMGFLAGEASLRIQYQGDLSIVGSLTKWRLVTS